MEITELIKLANTIEIDTDFAIVGLRIVDADYDGFDRLPGEVSPNSYRWDDGNHTDDEPNGTSVIMQPGQPLTFVDPVPNTGS